MNTTRLKKVLILSLPYVFVGLLCTNLSEAWRLAEGMNASEKLLSFFSTIGIAFSNPLPSFHPVDLLFGAACGGGFRLAVYLRGKNAKKFRHNIEYGPARWGTHKNIEPFMDPKFENNVILTRSERLMMGNRPKNPANARNKNVLIVGGSGSGKTRLWIKPNLLQLHSSYVLTDPKTVLNAKYAKKEIKEKVIRADQLVDYIKKMCKNSKEAEDSDERMLKRANFFLNLHHETETDSLSKYEKYRRDIPEETAHQNMESEDPKDTPKFQENELFEKLRAYRLKKSREEQIKPYYIMIIN